MSSETTYAIDATDDGATAFTLRGKGCAIIWDENAFSIAIPKLAPETEMPMEVCAMTQALMMLCDKRECEILAQKFAEAAGKSS